MLTVMISLLATAQADDDFNISMILLPTLAIEDIELLREEAEIATQDDSLLGEIIVHCGGDPTLPYGCWADIERLGVMEGIEARLTEDALTLRVESVDYSALIEIAHGAPQPLRR